MPRNHEGIALIGDPRNDVHLFTSQMVVAFIELHNRLVDRLRDDGVAEPERLRGGAAGGHLALPARDPARVPARPDRRAADRRAARRAARSCIALDGDPYIPFEFADAAYRYGHAQIRDRYQVNPHFGPVPGVPRPDGLRPGRARAHGRLDAADRRRGPRAGPARQAHRRAAPRPADRPADRRSPASEPGTDYASLANRDLQRGQAVGLASGEAVARRLGVPALSAEQVGLAEHGWAGETPLWFYILKEAEVLHDGDRLGPVGGRIVGEVLVGIIDGDPESFRSVDPGWSPTLPAGAPAPSASPTSWPPSCTAASNSAGGSFACRPGFSPVMTYAVTAPTSSQNAAGRAVGGEQRPALQPRGELGLQVEPDPERRVAEDVVDDAQLIERVAEQRMRLVARECHRPALAQLGAQLRGAVVRVALGPETTEQLLPRPRRRRSSVTHFLLLECTAHHSVWPS